MLCFYQKKYGLEMGYLPFFLVSNLTTLVIHRFYGFSQIYSDFRLKIV